MAEPSATDLSDHLPLRLINSEIVPPSPNISEYESVAIDWLPDFRGYSWVAYGASSLLVVSHFPSPLSHHQSQMGPIFRQVFHLPSPNIAAADVASVSWSPASPSSGDLAAAVDDRIFVFQYESTLGSFCWSQTALLLQSAKIEAIAWTGSGDGIISGGKDVLLWKRSTMCWEIAWKFRMNFSQSLVSSTWSLEGPSATCAYPTKLQSEGPSLMTSNASACVNVFQTDGKFGYVTTELRHPQPVLGIQWRPSGGCLLNRDPIYARRHVLLTSCLDGAVRLWSEIDGGRFRKSNKDYRDQSTSRRSFCVVAVIEINESLYGTVGKDIFLCWALEMEGVVCVGDKSNKLFSVERNQNDEVGRCEWLIGVGPSGVVTFWAVHCLDDIATMWSPRVTLWKKQQVLEPALGSFCSNDRARCIEGSHFKKVALWRNQHFGPPTICSIVQLFPPSSLAWSVLCNQSLLNSEDKSSHGCELDNNLTCQSGGVFDTLGHTGKILQVAVHPFKCEVELAVSLDSNGLLLFWSISTSSNSISGLPTLNPSWQLIGKIILQDSISQHWSLYWALSWFDEDQILLIGHVQGIDCLLVKTCETKEEKISCHKLCTIPFVGHDHIDGPDKVTSVPLHSTSKETFRFNHFLLLAIWKEKWRAELWKMTLHSYELSETCCHCNLETRNDADCSTLVYKADFAGKTYCIVVNPCSPHLPDIQDQVTSVTVVSPSMSCHQQKLDIRNDSCLNSFPYHVATGHSDGRCRLWRINTSELSVACTPFELVGMFSSCQGPVTAISVADWGEKIATVCSSGRTNSANMLYIWESLHLAGAGTVEVEDKICLNGNVVALRWFLIENVLFLGVCFDNELHIYCHRVYTGHSSLNLRKPSEASTWVCIAVAHTSSTICDFLLGPRATIIMIHDKYFSLFSHWSFLMSDKCLTDGRSMPLSALLFTNEMDRDIPAFFPGEIHIFEELSFQTNSQGTRCNPPLTKAHYDIPSCLLANGTQPVDKLRNKIHFLKMAEVAKKICGPLPFYHPKALLMNIFSGNWKRAYVAVCHLAECLPSNPSIEQKLSTANTIRQIKLSNYFEGQSSNRGANRGLQWSEDLNTDTWSSHSEGGMMQFTDSSIHDAFYEMLEKLHVLEAFTDSQKINMFVTIDLLLEISNSQSASSYESLDEPGKRFWCAIRLQQLDFLRRYSRMPLMEELVVDSLLIGWAFHSDCQANLFSTILPTDPTWEEMRKMGAGFWFTNITDLRTKMEKLARSRYLKSKDPKACALLYIALNRLQVLAGLFKISKDEKDKPLVAFLSRNFQEEKHKAAALKNAYVLMGKHQFELAIAFFLLGGDIISAITVCAKTVGDEQLALVICRLAEGQAGPSERHLISGILLPSSIEKGDYWLASVLEWTLGNYLQSFLIVLGLQGDSSVSESERSIKHAAFLEPGIGQYCQLMAAKHSLRNAIGEQNTAILSRWATVMTASAFNKSGLPLEALECLSSSASVLGVTDQGTDSKSSEVLPGILRPLAADSCRWLSHEVAFQLEYQVKLDLAVQYIAKLVTEHPCWLNTGLGSTEARACSLEHQMSQCEALLENFEQELDSALGYLEHKFSLPRDRLLCKIFVSLGNDRQLLIGFASQVHLPALSHIVDNSSELLKQLVCAAECLSCSISRFVTASSIASCRLEAASEPSISDLKPYYCFKFLEFYMRGFILSICSLRAALMVLYNGSTKELIMQSIIVLDLCSYCVYFASAMLQRNIRALAVMLQPLLVLCTDGNYRETDMVSLREILDEVVEALCLSPSANSCEDIVVTQEFCLAKGGNRMCMIPEDEKWIILSACLWQYLSEFIDYQLNKLSQKLTGDSIADTSALASSLSPEPDDNGSLAHVREVLMIFIEAIENTVTHTSFYSAWQLAIFFWKKVEDGTSISTLKWLEELSQSKSRRLHEHLDRSFGSSEALNQETSFSCSELLARICGEPEIVSEVLNHLPIKLSQLVQWKPFKGWNQLHKGAVGEHERFECYKREGFFDSSPRGNENASPSAGSESNHNLLDSDKKDVTFTKKAVPFHNPREIYRRNGELLEALCVNSFGQQQAAVASNKKGISFFNWGDGLPPRDPSDYIWFEADWPRNSWAGTLSTSVPACVSPGVGLESDKGSQHGSNGAIEGSSSFGFPGYSGIGATGMGWGMQEDFDNVIDPPATLDNISARTLASHPSRPLFLVGSSNTHIYLWEFGSEKAAATYGVLPATNIPPPYPLASITALQFDCCGHRFANGASDGTVCTWQPEVGGRSNVGPTESSLCFSGHTSDICYVATSGSIIAAAGYSSNGVNVVIWDTLAPPASSQASVMCHEGGACSIAVFDNDVGTGSISPLIVTGGKGGDVGLHDFRYIATGKTKRQRHLNTVGTIPDAATLDVRSELSPSVGDQNRHGMLWYIPKAHSGSITKISTIPNTSLFLTGSKDGDVKLWDARRASLVFHWPKLHERHTFLQRSSQSFGGVTRVGVTDIQVISDGFLTCGGDSTVKLIQLNNFSP